MPDKSNHEETPVTANAWDRTHLDAREVHAITVVPVHRGARMNVIRIPDGHIHVYFGLYTSLTLDDESAELLIAELTEVVDWPSRAGYDPAPAVAERAVEWVKPV